MKRKNNPRARKHKKSLPTLKKKWAVKKHICI